MYKNFEKVISELHSCVIVVHKSPDGDAIGSAVGLKRFLELMDKKVHIILPDRAAAFLCWMDDADDFIVAEEQKEQAEKLLSNCDFIFCLDFNAYNRTGKIIEKALETSTLPKFLIDHHPHPNVEQFDHRISHTEATSTAEILADVFHRTSSWKQMDLIGLEALYLGIVTDSGSFRFPSVKSKTHQLVAAMIDIGLEPYRVHEKVFDNNRIERLKLRAFTISEKMEYFDSIVLMSLTKEEMKQYNHQPGDTEGLVNQGLSISGVKASIFFKEKDNGGVKISFRSKGDIHINKLAEAHFNGGGHQYAAGGLHEGTIEEAITLLKSKIADYV